MSKFTGKHLDGSCRHWYHRDSSKLERRRQDEKKNAGDLISGVDALDPAGGRQTLSRSRSPRRKRTCFHRLNRSRSRNPLFRRG